MPMSLITMKSKLISKQEKTRYHQAKDFLECSGYEVDRSFFGSEDGEAIVYRKKGNEEWHFLCHLDPMFVEIEDVEGYVKKRWKIFNSQPKFFVSVCHCLSRRIEQ